MTSNIKYSWFLNQKNVKRIKNVRNRYHRKVSRLTDIQLNANAYGIKLGEETYKEIENKKSFYYAQMRKLYSYMTDLERGGVEVALKNIERHYTTQEVGKYKTESGILKVLRKLF
jgi:hypothetical protein